jgi:preprotein translocase subunit SecA
LDELAQALKGIFHLPPDFAPEQWQGLKQDAIVEQAARMALDAYAAKEAEVGEAAIRQTEKQIMLWAVDHRWVRHLTDLDRLREGIGLQAFAQVDPLVAYKREAFNMYGELMNDIRSDIVKAIFTIQAQRQQPVRLTPTPMARNIRTNRDGGNSKPQTVRKSGPELGRNDLCWCGSGKKYKNCHLREDKAKASGSRAPAGR